MLLINIISSLLIQWQTIPSPAVVKVYDGKSWEIRGLIQNDPYWDAMIKEFGAEKPYYSHGSCCYNEKFKNGIVVEGGNLQGGHFFDNALPNGITTQFRMYWRGKRVVENPNEPGYVQTASKKLSKRIRDYISNSKKMSQSINSTLENCVGRPDTETFGSCRYSYWTSSSTVYNPKDSSEYKVINTFQVILNPRTKLNPGNRWVTVLDSLGVVVQVPESAIQEYLAMLRERFGNAQSLNSDAIRDNLGLVAWAISRYECVVIDKTTNSIKRQILRKSESNMYQSSQYIHLNEHIKLLERGMKK